MAENNANDSDRDGDYPSMHLPQQQQEETSNHNQQEPSSSSEATITNALFSETRMTDRRLTNSDDMFQERAQTTIQQPASAHAQHQHQHQLPLVVSTTTTTEDRDSSTNVEVMLDGAQSSSFVTGSATTTTTTESLALTEEPTTTTSTRSNPAAIAESSSVERTAHSTISEEIQPAPILVAPPRLPEAATESEGIHHERMAVVSTTMTNIAITPAPQALVIIEQDRPDSGVVVDRMNTSMNGASAKLIVLPCVTVSTTASNPDHSAAETRGEAVNSNSNNNKSSLTAAATKKKRTPQPFQPGQATGRWTHAEHEAFMEGLKIFGREWKKVAVRIPTRTSAQVRSHAQKYFSKLSRDEQLMEPPLPLPPAAAAPAADPSSSVETHHPALATAEAYPPSLQRNVERILANPEQAQRDVEDTLQALRARYHQLQQRLQEHRSSNNNASNSSLAAHVEEEKESQHRDECMEEEAVEGPHQQPLPQLSSSQQEQQRMKRRRPQQNSDDCSMASSTLSALGNEELIALSVLGATLPNIGSPVHHSSNNNHAAAPADEAAGHHGNSSSNAQSNSSLESHSSSSSTSSTNSAAKRKRDEAA